MYPISLKLSGKNCVVIGGGRVAERKVLGILNGGGRVLVISPEGTTTIRRLADLGKLKWIQRDYRSGDLGDVQLVFAATNSREVQKTVVKEARQKGLLINVADAPDECDFQVPATIHHGDLTIAVSTNGKSPAVAALVKRKVQEHIGDEYRLLLQVMTIVRRQVLGCRNSQQDKKILFQNVLHEDIIDWIRAGRWDRLQEHLQRQLGPDFSIDLRPLKQDEP